MRKLIELTVKLRWTMLLACLAWIWPQASADVTVFVQATSAPKLYVFSTSGTCSATASGTAFSSYTTWSGATMSKSVTTSDNKKWFYEVFTGLNSCSIILNNGSSQTDDITSVSGTKYYYFNGTNKYIDLTGCKTASAYCFLETSTSYWEQASARFQVWDGSADVWMTQVGSVRNGGKIYLYTKSSSVTDGNTFYFKRMSSDGNSKWNEGSAPYHKGGYYTNTGWSNVSYQSGSSFGTIVWPTIPADPTLTYTLHVYDPDGAPKVNGTTLTATTSGTNCTWYTYTVTGTTLPSSITLTSHNGSKSQTITPADGVTDYRAFNGYSIQTVPSDYDPAVRHLVYWPGSGNYASDKTDVTLTTTDGINYTATDITLSESTYFVFATSVPASWNNASFYTTNSGDQTYSGTSATATAVHGGNNAYKLTNVGIWSFSYNIITNVWTATRTGDIPTNTFTLHVIDYNGATPTLYAWDASGNLNGDFPGTVMSTTEVSAAGETWYVKSFTTTAATINAIVSLGSSETQTTDITGIAPGDYYIVYNSQTKAYTGSTTCPEGKVQKQKNTFTVYVLADNAPYIYLWNDNNQTIGAGWPGAVMSTTEQLADGNSWRKFEVETWDDDINLLFNDGNGNQTGDIKQTAAVGYYVYNGTTSAIATVEPTGEMYVIGQVAGNPWAANSGLKMTAASDGTTFTLNNVQIISGATFAFATALGSDEDDWTGLQHYRLATNADGDLWVVTNAQTDKDNPTAIGLHAWSGADKTLKMDETAFYDITVDMKAMTATIKRRYGAMYMFYGNSESPYWKPNAGVPMFTTDGNTFMLTNVTLGDGDTFQFASQLASTDTGWNEIAAYRYGSNAQGSYWEVTSEEIGITLENALLSGSTKNFQMDPGTSGTYRVVINPTEGTVTLYPMAEVLDSKTILHLEQTSNVTAPRLWAYDKERDVTNEYYIHEDRPSRDVIATSRRVFFNDEEPIAAKEVTTADGRKWWTWEIDNSIVDFWFTRNGYDYGSVKATAIENADMTDIQWRKSGEIYLTWPTTGTALDEYTRDYYAAAAQEAADCAVMLEGHEYAYFTNTPGWSHVFCHAWYTDQNGINHDLLTPPAPYEGDPCYPGALCQMVGYDKDGYEVWRIDLTAAGVTQYPNGGILFNNGIDDNHVYEHDMNHDYYTGTGTEAAKEQSGDFVYRTGTCYDYCGVIVLGRSLSNIVVKGIQDGPVYTIEEDLVGVYFDENAITTIEVDGETYDFCGALYCKDLNNFVSTPNVEKSLQKEDQIDYLKIYYNGDTPVPDRYDQSNWVKLTLSSQYPGYESVRHNVEGQLALLRDYVGKVLPAESVRGQLVNNYNPEMRLALQELPAANQCKTNNYKDNPNVFVTSNFLEAQSQKTDENGNTFNFFVVNPKPQEYAHITWAVYGGNNQFFIPSKEVYSISETGGKWWVNEFDLDGYFPVSWDIMHDAPNLTVGESYDFFAIIRLAEESGEPAGGGNSAPRRADKVTEGVSVPYKTNVTSSRYVVSPVDISVDNIITGVKDLTMPAVKHIKQVRYISPMGQESSKPFEGVNIVVTRYDDGSQYSRKVIY